MPNDSKRLIVVSNRLPVSLAKDGHEWRTTRSAGGLATAMDPILRRHGGVWIGWSGSKEEESPEALELLRREQGCIAVDLPGGLAERFYEGYANQALWPLFHSFTSRLKFDPDAWRAYIEANDRFCAAVAEQYREGDSIWIHDYHLMLLPRLLRERLPEAAIGFFLHIPFPASDVFSILPRGEELLTGLLGADFAAFHTHVHLQHFRRSVRKLLGIESTVDRVAVPGGREMRIQALPIGIAPEDFVGQVHTPEAEEEFAKLRTQFEGKKLIVAVDRLDYTKGLPERLRTYRRLLESSPELRGRVVMIQVAVPSRENIESYQELTSEVHELIAEINGSHGSPTWVPVVYLHRGISRPELVALYRAADLAWVSPLRDGMNLVAKEFVACKPEGDGVLVLSAFAGAAAEMGEAILVNPLDEERTAEAVTLGLEMAEDEKRERMRALHRRVVDNNVFVWGERFLSALDGAASNRREREWQESRPLDPAAFSAAYRRARGRRLFLDYDGTLVGFVARPEDAVPGERLRNVLTRLADDPSNEIFVLSGRCAADLERWLGDFARLGLAAEHGAKRREPGSREWQGRPAPPAWKDTVRPILEHYVERIPGSFVEEKEFALVWHFRTAEAEFGDWVATEVVAMLDGMLAETELRAYRGNKIVEVKPIWASKGAFVRDRLSGGDAHFVLAIGDDRTDEDMFTELPEDGWSVHVGDGPSRARYCVASVSAVLGFFEAIA